MKAREERRKVLIKTRMCVGATWGDAAVLNISSRGLLLSAGSPSPPRGSYLEVRRGPHIVVGRVIWSDGQCFGVKAQDPIAVDAFVSNRQPQGGPAEADPAGPVERRAVRRPEQRHERSRQLGRAMQFACLAILGATAAFVAFGSVGRVFAKPLASVEAILAP